MGIFLRFAPLLVALLVAGCAAPPPDAQPESYRDMGFDGSTWPRLDGVTLTILDHGAFAAFDDAAAQFENLTGAKVVHMEADDAGGALSRAALEKGDPTFDIIYGIDNVLWTKAVDEGIFGPYRPLLADRIDPGLVFFGAEGAWHATPVDHGYVAVNWDPAHPALGGAQLRTLDDVKAHASAFVTQDPRTSTPGLGFLLATIATYPDDWDAYWQALFAGGALVTSGWSEAYEQHFSAGYGVAYGGQGDKPIVTSYTTSPAYEAFFGRPNDTLARVITGPSATFHQVETMGIAKGAPNRAAAEAWIEYTLTDGFQALVAPAMAVYPVVGSVDVSATFGGHDPDPAKLQPAALSHADIGANVERWIAEWVALCEAADCA